MISSKTFVIQLIEFDEKLKRIRYSGDNATLKIYLRDIGETLNNTRGAMFDIDALIPDFLLFKFREVYVGFGEILDKYFVNRPEPVTDKSLILQLL